MALIDLSFFTKNLIIGGLENTLDGQPNNLLSYIDRYEPLFLTALLSKDLYEQFKVGLNDEDPIPEKWVNLRNEIVDQTFKISPIANFIYYVFRNDNDITSTVGIGEVKPKSENSMSVNPYPKMVKAWNEMVFLNNKILLFLWQNKEVYGINGHCYFHHILPEEMNIFAFKNTLNI